VARSLLRGARRRGGAPNRCEPSQRRSICCDRATDHCRAQALSTSCRRAVRRARRAAAQADTGSR